MVDSWTFKKWEYLKKYLHAYTTIVSCHFPYFIYIDLFAGEGMYDGYFGSPLISLDLEYPFTNYYFIEKKKKRFDLLTKNTSGFSNREAVVFRKKRNEHTKKIIINPKRTDATEYINNELKNIPNFPSFLFIDPHGNVEIGMDSIQKCSQKPKVELLINFSVMGVIRNVEIPRCHETLTKYYGNDEWKQVPLRAIDRGQLYLDLYITSLKNHFRYVVTDELTNDNNAPLYYLIYATNNQSGFKIMKDVMKQKDKQSKLNFDEIPNP